MSGRGSDWSLVLEAVSLVCLLPVPFLSYLIKSLLASDLLKYSIGVGLLYYLKYVDSAINAQRRCCLVFDIYLLLVRPESIEFV